MTEIVNRIYTVRTWAYTTDWKGDKIADRPGSGYSTKRVRCHSEEYAIERARKDASMHGKFKVDVVGVEVE